MTKEELEKKAEDFAIIECCSTCSIKNPYSCEEKCECWTFATEGVKFGYSKANEWHYVKDGKLPKTGNPCLVYLVNDCAIVARLREDNVWTTDGHNAFENVIAWKKIVPPKGSVINDFS